MSGEHPIDDAGIRYRDKVTIVTGGSRGIGQACVELFGRCIYETLTYFCK